MALSDAQIEMVREIVDDLSFTTVSTFVADLNAAQKLALLADVDLWERVKSDHLIISGSKEGLDINAERDREAIRRRVRLRLGLSAISSARLAANPSAIQSFVLGGGSYFDTESEY